MIDSITSQTTAAGEQNTSETKLPSPVAEIDITRDVCPMTFVRTRLALDRLSPGDILLVRLSGEEPLRNVPRTAAAQGHLCLHQETRADGVTELWLQRG